MTVPKQILDHFGIAADDVSDSAELEVGRDTTAEGMGARELLTLAMLYQGQIAAADFASPRNDIMERHGLIVEVVVRQKTLVKVRNREGSAIELRAMPGASSMQDPASRHTGCLDLGSAAVMIRTATGDRVLLYDTGAQPGVAELASAPANVDVTASLGWPVAEWAQVAGDPWISTTVAEILSAGGPWSEATAAGLIVRLADTPGKPGDALESYLAGKSSAPWRDAFRRFGDLSPAATQTLQHLGLAALDGLRDDLRDLSDDSAATSRSSTVRRLAGLLHGRDDLECVLLVLHHARKDAELLAAVAAFDRDARPAVFSLPAGLLPHDERLRRALVRNPNAWWAEMALEP